jgi:hypothetical protein
MPDRVDSALTTQKQSHPNSHPNHDKRSGFEFAFHYARDLLVVSLLNRLEFKSRLQSYLPGDDCRS